jgi:hypothetical protein
VSLRLIEISGKFTPINHFSAEVLSASGPGPRAALSGWANAALSDAPIRFITLTAENLRFDLIKQAVAPARSRSYFLPRQEVKDADLQDRSDLCQGFRGRLQWMT